MQQKLILTCVATAALAVFVVAPVASASPVLTSEGSVVAVGAEVKGNNTGTFIFDEGGYTISCEKVTLAAKVAENSGTKIQLEAAAGGLVMTGAGAGGDCTASWGPATLTWPKMCFATIKGSDSLSITGCGSSITMTTNITGVITCQYAVGSISASYLTNQNATFSLSSIPLVKTEGSGAFCPSEIKFSLDLDLTTTSGAALAIS
jgi:hypothetical protein